MKRFKIAVLILGMLFPICGNATPPVIESNAYWVTTKTWTNAYENLIRVKAVAEGVAYIAPLKGNGLRDRLHKNKARDTIVFIPKNATFKKSLDIIFYFHGLGGFKERDFKTRVLRHTKSFSLEKNYIIVVAEMPWSKNTSTPRSRQGRVFTGKNQFSDFVGSVLDVAKVHFKSTCKQTCPYLPYSHPTRNLAVDNVSLIGHSAGGSALMSISRSGGLNWLEDVAKVKTLKVIFSDASYGYWLDTAWKHFKPKTDISINFIVLTRKFDKPYRNAKRFLKRFKITPQNITHHVFNRRTTHADIGDQSLIWVYLSDESGCGEGEIE
jgi:hypothetical protein